MNRVFMILIGVVRVFFSRPHHSSNHVDYHTNTYQKSKSKPKPTGEGIFEVCKISL